MGRNKYYTYSFEKLEVWQIAREITMQVYTLSRHFPDEEKYGITSQIRRSLNGVTDNLAEGSGRATNSDRAHFTNIAYSSALEAINQLIVAHDQNYLSTETYENLRVQMDELTNKLNSFYRFQLNKGKSVKDRFENQ